jgi:hypothetical protein
LKLRCYQKWLLNFKIIRRNIKFAKSIYFLFGPFNTNKINWNFSWHEHYHKWPLNFKIIRMSITFAKPVYFLFWCEQKHKEENLKLYFFREVGCLETLLSHNSFISTTFLQIFGKLERTLIEVIQCVKMNSCSNVFLTNIDHWLNLTIFF